MTSGMPFGRALRRFALLRVVLWLYTYVSASFWIQGIASQRKTSLLGISSMADISVDTACIPISNVNTVIPLPLNTLLQKGLETSYPCSTESPPHLFGFDVRVAMFPLMLNWSRKGRVKSVANVCVGICNIVIFGASVALGDTRCTYEHISEVSMPCLRNNVPPMLLTALRYWAQTNLGFELFHQTTSQRILPVNPSTHPCQ